MGKTMLREPGYPLLLAAVFKLGGYGLQQARLVCVLLAFGAALFLLRLTPKDHWRRDDRAGRRGSVPSIPGDLCC